jgi:hypothetical protein
MQLGENVMDRPIGSTPRIFNILKTVSGLVSLGLWTASCFLWYHYAFAGHSQPDAQTGRIYPEHQIGEVFYLTSHERSLWYFVTIAGLACFFLAAIFYSLERQFAPRD